MIIGRISGIGRSQGIGRAAGSSSVTFDIDSIIIKLNKLQTTTLDAHFCVPNKTSNFDIDTHILTGIYTSTFTIDAEILKCSWFTIDSLLMKEYINDVTIDSHISSDKISQSNIDCTISNQHFTSVDISAMLEKQNIENSFNIDSHLATYKYNNSYTVDSHICIPNKTKTFTIDAHYMLTNYKDACTIDTEIALFKTKSITLDCILFDYPKYILNDYDITNHIKQPDINGLTKKLNKYTAPYQLISTIIDMGTESLQYVFELTFQNIHEYDEFLTSVNSDTRDIIFYPGRDDFFHKIKAVSSKPTFIFHGAEYRTQITLDLEDPYLYSVHAYEHELGTVASGYITPEFRNEGSVDSPYEELEITGVYYNGSHLLNAGIYVMDGFIEESYIPISDKLLTDEIASMDIYGKLTCDYFDDFDKQDKFNNDVYESSNVTYTKGCVTIGPNGYLTYKFYGPHPTMYNSLLVSEMEVVSGDPYIQVSTDNTTWETAVRSDQIVSNVEENYYINGSEKLADFYVRFYCPSGATLNIYYLDFITDRDATFYEIPSIPPWEERALKVVGDGSGIAGIRCVFRARKWP